MNLTELNSEFTLLFEDLATQGTKGLDAYERSVCFTHIQEQMVLSMAKEGILDPISSLIKYNEESNPVQSIYSTAKDFAKVTNPLYVLEYFIKSDTQGDISTIPANENLIRSLLASAYKYPPKNLAYVVMGETKNTVFPPFNYELKSFITKYVKYPTPVILAELTDGMTINELTTPTSPVLDASFHRALVRESVKYAIEVYIGQQEKEVQNDSRRNE